MSVILLILGCVSSFKLIQKFKNLAKKRDWPAGSVSGPDLHVQLFKDKNYIITVITIKDRTNRI